jgi:sugar phosphate isomerase/epimerase
MKIGTSTYSYWHFRGEKYPVEKVLEHAADWGLDGVEILHRQMASEDNATLQSLKRTAFTLGLDLYALSIHQDFVNPHPVEQERQIAHTRRCIEVAHELGVPCIRLNSGRWKTIKDFSDLMKTGGVEPPLEGCSEDDAFHWVIQAIESCLNHAERYGVILALENHWGLTRTAGGVLRIVEALNSPWLQGCLDTGNLLITDQEPWQPDYAGMERLAPHAVLVHTKTYFGGGEWYALNLDYARIAAMLRQVNFRGYVSLEFEGKEDAATAVPRSVEILKSHFACDAQTGVL